MSECRAFKLRHGWLTCVCPILTSCSELSHRVVSPAYAPHSADLKPAPFLAVTHAALSLIGNIWTLSAQNRHPARPAEKTFRLRGLASSQDFVSVLTVRPFTCPYDSDISATRDGRFDLLRYRTVPAELLARSESGPRGWLNYVRSFLCNSER